MLSEYSAPAWLMGRSSDDPTMKKIIKDYAGRDLAVVKIPIILMLL